jgi:ABC-2 type transport system ATP-binding protein
MAGVKAGQAERVPVAGDPSPAAVAPEALADSVIHAAGLTKRFEDETVVRDVNLEVGRGTIFGFIGPSGSGKTTTLRMLMGIVEPTAGEITVLGQRPADFTQAVRERIGYMPQLSVLYPELSVVENLNFAASLYGMGLFRGRRFKELLQFVELEGHKSKLIRSLSGGMQRRLSLASTLIHDPELLFLDEPTAGVDPVLRRKFWDYFKELRGRGRTLFVTTQYVSEAAYCDQVAVMHQGQLLMVETPDGLRRRAMGGEVVDMRASRPLSIEEQRTLEEQLFVRGLVTRRGPNHMRIVVDDASLAIPALMEWCQARNLTVESLEPYQPEFDDVFVELVRGETPDA